MQTSKLCLVDVCTKGATHAFVLVGSNAYADTGCAHNNAALANAVGNSLRRLVREVGIVATIAGVGTEIHHLVSLFPEIIAKHIFKFKTAVVASN